MTAQSIQQLPIRRLRTRLVVRDVAIRLAALSLWVNTSGVGAENLKAFATSTVGTGDMHSWPEVFATSLMGINAADGICQARAAVAGLTQPESYVAWLSDRDNDAYCRVFGLSGRKADNCGLPYLPKGAGPWERLDGIPFADTIEQALDGDRVYSPLDVDEFGNEFHAWALSFTSTNTEGTFNTTFEPDADCERWTSASSDPTAPFPTLGSNLSSSRDWTFNDTGVSCNGHRRLMCLQRGSGPPLQGHSMFGHREAFLSSEVVMGNLGGLQGADKLCQSLASKSGLHNPNSFKALLASENAVNALDRFVFDGAWYRLDGLIFAHAKAEIASGTVALPLNMTEEGHYVGWSYAWTGANQDGSPSGYDCGGWNMSGGSVGMASPVHAIAFPYITGHWLDTAQTSCSGPQQNDDWTMRLYCLSDSDSLFHSEFDELSNSL